MPPKTTRASNKTSHMPRKHASCVLHATCCRSYENADTRITCDYVGLVFILFDWSVLLEPLYSKITPSAVNASGVLLVLPHPSLRHIVHGLEPYFSGDLMPQPQASRRNQWVRSEPRHACTQRSPFLPILRRIYSAPADSQSTTARCHPSLWNRLYPSRVPTQAPASTRRCAALPC